MAEPPSKCFRRLWWCGDWSSAVLLGHVTECRYLSLEKCEPTEQCNVHEKEYDCTEEGKSNDISREESSSDEENESIKVGCVIITDNSADESNTERGNKNNPSTPKPNDDCQKKIFTAEEENIDDHYEDTDCEGDLDTEYEEDMDHGSETDHDMDTEHVEDDSDRIKKTKARTKVFHGKRSKSQSLNKSYSQDYRTEWEKLNWAKQWLTKYAKNKKFGYCSWCDKKLLARLSVIKKHSESQKHRKAKKDIYSASGHANVLGVCSSVATAELNMVALIARRNIPFRFSDHLISMLKFIDPKSKIISRMNCGRTKTAYLLTECLAPYAHTDLVRRLRESKGFSILCDKATDVTAEQTFCVNVRFFEEDKAITAFYRLIKIGLHDGRAQGLFDLLDKALCEDNLQWSSVLGYASDGENLMQGGNDSVMTRVRDKAPNIFVLKCFCHSFHLVASYACQHLSKSAEQLVHDVYNYFKTSAKRQQKFEEFQKAFNVAPHKILKPAQTRWLSLSQCVRRLMEQWPALSQYFYEEAHLPVAVRNPAANRIYTMMKENYVKGTLQFLDYVLPDFTTINKMLQSDEFKLHSNRPLWVSV